MEESSVSTEKEIVKVSKEENNEIIKGDNENVKVEDDPYAYLDRGDFSSENFKIEIKNLPKFYGVNEFRKLLNLKLKLNSNKIKIPKRNSPYAFVCFRNEEDRQQAILVIKGYKWKGKELQAIKAKPAPDPLVKKRNENFDEDQQQNKKIRTDEPQLSIEERLKTSTIPYWNIDYKEQLKLKEDELKKILKKFCNDLHHFNPEIRNWLDKQKQLYDGLPCEFLNIQHPELYDGYRNKCEFSVGINEETGLKTVGFRIGRYSNGITGVGPVDNLIHIPACMKKACQLFQDYVRSSDLDIFNTEVHTGHFRQLCARMARPAQLMLIVGIHPQDLSDEKLNDFKKSLIDFFGEGPGKEAGVTSLYYQAIVKKNPGEFSSPTEHLWGDTHIYETIQGLKFRISPEAFFQINTPAAEILYKTAIDFAAPNENSTILDVCCGTGTIGLCFAEKCKEVLGIEIVPQAIIDAEENAKINKIENSQFFAGKAEEILGSVCFKAKDGSDLIAVVDPPRAGLLKQAILQLRKIEKISKLVYISCNPSLALKNFVDLGRPESKTVHGDMFVPVRAIGIDMFPYTKHCELVICFERWEKVSGSILSEKE